MYSFLLNWSVCVAFPVAKLQTALGWETCGDPQCHHHPPPWRLHGTPWAFQKSAAVFFGAGTLYQKKCWSHITYRSKIPGCKLKGWCTMVLLGNTYSWIPPHLFFTGASKTRSCWSVISIIFHDSSRHLVGKGQNDPLFAAQNLEAGPFSRCLQYSLQTSKTNHFKQKLCPTHLFHDRYCGWFCVGNLRCLQTQLDDHLLASSAEATTDRPEQFGTDSHLELAVETKN